MKVFLHLQKTRKIREKFTVSCEAFSVPESNRIRPWPLFTVDYKSVYASFLDSGPHMSLKEWREKEGAPVFGPP